MPTPTENIDRSWNVGGYRLTRVHDSSGCEGRACMIHNPSDNIQNREDWPYHFRNDRGIWERLCEHKVGHPDKDEYAFFASIGRGHEGIHGCDRCCQD